MVDCAQAPACNPLLQLLPVHGLKPVQCVALPFALAYNLMLMATFTDRYSSRLFGPGCKTLQALC